MQCLGMLISGFVVYLAVWSADAVCSIPARYHDRRRIAPFASCLQRETFAWLRQS